jgi:glycosyltransferase involved in cell wall biosynthesis
VRISVVVPARNAAATIGATLAALAAQRTDQDYEVIVVDSGSRDQTPAIVQAAGTATLLHNPGGEPAGSRNLGARHGTGAVLAFTDADCEPAPDWLAAGHRALGQADIVQGRVAPVGPAGPFDRSLSVEREYGLYETANLFATRAVFDRVDGFQPVIELDQGRAHPFGEDVWFVWRARRAGASTAFAADAVVQHAVFPRSARAYVAERSRCRYFPPLVARIPELRDGFLHHRVFLSPDSLRFDAALGGLLVGLLTRRRVPALLAALPYAAALARDTRGAAGAQRALFAASRIAADALTCAALAWGDLAARTLVL